MNVFFLMFIYLAVPGLKCSTQDLRSPLWHVGSSVACSPFLAARGIQLSDQRRPRPPALGVWSLSHWTTKEVPRTILNYLGGSMSSRECRSKGIVKDGQSWAEGRVMLKTETAVMES